MAVSDRITRGIPPFTFSAQIANCRAVFQEERMIRAARSEYLRNAGNPSPVQAAIAMAAHNTHVHRMRRKHCWIPSLNAAIIFRPRASQVAAERAIASTALTDAILSTPRWATKTAANTTGRTGAGGVR